MDKVEQADRTRCQAEELEGSFMTLGPRKMKRCTEKPICILRERMSGEKKERGEMSMCTRHLEAFKKYDNRLVDMEMIQEDCESGKTSIEKLRMR